ncbi:MAG: VacJ family lipoprotein [Opitutaceae bacterium]|nr:VacJ family lipoprotein [Opitutaceae bacterium]
MTRRRPARLPRLLPGWSLALLCAGVWMTPVRALAQTPASIYDEDPATLSAPPIPDRIEGFNRTMFKVNDGLYKVTLRPISKVYGAIVPAPLRRSVGRFFHNLAYPTRFVGNLFEGKVGAAGTETARFVVNTVTSLGFVATADQFPTLKERPSDLGQAFGTWGMGHGTYVVLPLLGPSSVRDGVGLGLSGYFLDPVRYLQEWEYRAIGSGVEIINQSPEQMQAYDQLKAGSIDAYVALRDAYSAQRSRRKAVETQTPAAPAVPAAAATTPPP